MKEKEPATTPIIEIPAAEIAVPNESSAPWPEKRRYLAYLMPDFTRRLIEHMHRAKKKALAE